MSVEYRTIPIESVIVDRDLRQRRDLKDLSSLMQSITEIGLINAPVVTHDLVLIAGERRLTSCRNLGHTHITVAIREAMPTGAQRQIELAENVDRLELDWKDRCFAVSEYHDIAVAESNEWTQEDTATALNMGRVNVTRHIALAEELLAGTPLIIGAAAFSVALGVMDRTRERRASAEADKLRGMLSGKPATPAAELDLSSLDLTPTAAPARDSRFEESPVYDIPTVSGTSPFRCTDFNRFATSYTGTPFNFLHCDFPYGINAGKHRSGAAKSFGGYADSEDVYWMLIASLAKCMPTIVAESAHMMFWYSMDFHTETVEALTDMGWKVNPHPLIWFRSDNSGILPDPKRGPRRNYESCLICTRGDRKIIQAVSNVMPHPNVKLIHMSEKPIPMLRHFFRMFVDDSSNMLDPTMGSGNAVVLAESLGATARGLEMDKTFYATARDKYISEGYDLGDDVS
tara:strand:- start:2700 stop:4073 length:1374 start_codon:yes stop_codon:yes gene_type:complete